MVVFIFANKDGVDSSSEITNLSGLEQRKDDLIDKLGPHDMHNSDEKIRVNMSSLLLPFNFSLEQRRFCRNVQLTKLCISEGGGIYTVAELEDFYIIGVLRIHKRNSVLLKIRCFALRLRKLYSKQLGIIANNIFTNATLVLDIHCHITCAGNLAIPIKFL